MWMSEARVTTAYSRLPGARAAAEASAAARPRPRRLGRPVDLGAGPERGPLEHLAQVALVEELGTADRALGGEVGHDLELGHLGPLPHDYAVARVCAADVQHSDRAVV